MRTGVNRIIGLPVALTAAVCVCAGLLSVGCAKKNDAAKPVVEDLSPSPINATNEEVPTVAANPTTVVVTVYGKTLTSGQVDEQTSRAMSSPQLKSMSSDMVAKAKKRINKDVVDRFVVQCILENEAEARKISVDDKAREEELAVLKTSLPAGMSMEQMVAMSGMGMEEFNERITQELKVRRLLDSQTTNIAAPTAEEIVEFYSNSPAAFQMPEYARVRHILVAYTRPGEMNMPGEEPVKPGDEASKAGEDAAKAEKRKKAESLREELVKGADFEAAAKANSDCPSKMKGGDLGRVAKGQTVPEFEKAAFSQEINAIGPVVETQFGFHIIQVLSKGEAGLLPLKEVESEISEHLLNGKRRQVVMDFIDKLKAQAKVEYAK